MTVLATLSLSVVAAVSDGVEVISKKIAANPQMAEMPIIPFSETVVSDFQKKTGTDYIPVILGVNAFLIDAKGTSLVPANTLYYFDGKSQVAPAQNVLIPHILTDEALRGYPQHDLPKGVKKTADMYVFTDPTCGYCKAFERDLSVYLKAGVQVHYIPWPRSGLNVSAEGYQQLVSSVCSSQALSEQASAYHDLMITDGAKQPAQPKSFTEPCAKKVEEGYRLGHLIGVQGTPYIYVKDVNGKESHQPGYVASEQFLASLGLAPKESAVQKVEATAPAVSAPAPTASN